VWDCQLSLSFYCNFDWIWKIAGFLLLFLNTFYYSDVILIYMGGFVDITLHVVLFQKGGLLACTIQYPLSIFQNTNG
jgi:hypothetical protein